MIHTVNLVSTKYVYSISASSPNTYRFTFDIPQNQPVESVEMCDNRQIPGDGYAVWTVTTVYALVVSPADPTKNRLTWDAQLTNAANPPSSCNRPAPTDPDGPDFDPDDIENRFFFNDGTLIVTITGGGTSQIGTVNAGYTIDP